MKSLSKQGWEAYKSFREIKRQVASLQKRAEFYRQEFENAVGKAHSVQAPGGLIIYREIIQNPGYVVDPFCYSIYKEGKK